METYTVTVATGTSEYSGTNNYIFVTLLGEHGESERTLLDNPGLDFCRGAVCAQTPAVYLCLKLSASSVSPPPTGGQVQGDQPLSTWLHLHGQTGEAEVLGGR